MSSSPDKHQMDLPPVQRHEFAEDYADKQLSRPHQKRKGLALASIAIGTLSGACLVGLFAYLIAMVASDDTFEPSEGVLLVVGFAFLAGVGAAMVGGLLGVLGLFLPGQSRLLAGVGVAINGLIVGAVAAIFVIGIAVG